MKGVSGGDISLEEIVLPEFLQLREKTDHR